MVCSSLVCSSAVCRRGGDRGKTHVKLLAEPAVLLVEDSLEGARVAHPLEQTTLLVEGHDSVRADICVSAATLKEF